MGGLIGIGLGVRALIRARRYISLKGRTVLITGGSRGLGLTLARLAAAEGANVAICGRDEEELERARQDLERRGGRVLAVPCDIGMETLAEDLVRSVVQEFGTIDVLINNAGIIQVGPMEEMTVEDYHEAMKTHFEAHLYTTLAVLPIMRGKRAGRIVNITSIGGKVAAPHLLPYTASKFALVGFSEGLRAELAKDNIFVTTVVPGFFRSGSPRNAFFKGQHRKEYAWFATADVLPGISISPETMARRILRAAKHGQAELITPLVASLQARVNGLVPGLVSELSSLITWFLPAPGGIRNGRSTGAQSQGGAPAFVRRWVNSAGEAHNEMG
jgi:NAD(P)-dependent dehydrogenase (short-subunit alcohol dehydrogenase family)